MPLQLAWRGWEGVRLGGTGGLHSSGEESGFGLSALGNHASVRRQRWTMSDLGSMADVWQGPQWGCCEVSSSQTQLGLLHCR